MKFYEHVDDFRCPQHFGNEAKAGDTMNVASLVGELCLVYDGDWEYRIGMDWKSSQGVAEVFR